MGFSFYFSSLYPAPYIEFYVCKPIQISYLNFRAVLVLPKIAGSVQTHKSVSFIWIVLSTLYVYLCSTHNKQGNESLVHLVQGCYCRAVIRLSNLGGWALVYIFVLFSQPTNLEGGRGVSPLNPL